MKKKNEVVFKRHNFYWKVSVPVQRIICRIARYQGSKKFDMKKGESYIILANHQTDLDGIVIGCTFTRPFHALVTDTFFSNGKFSAAMKHMYGLIPKKKASLDLKANLDMARCVREGGSLLIFPEGNRSYGEFQFPFTSGFGKFIKFFNKPVVIFNFHGGFGVNPRWGKEKRDGKFYGEVKRVIQPEEFKEWSNEEFEKVLHDELRVIDAESGALFKSDCKAEYLERMFFVCPKCGAISSLSSKGDHLTCSSCGLDVEYTEDLHLVSKDKDFKYNKIVDWYNYQIRFVRDYEVTDKPIFKDCNVKLYVSEPDSKRKLLHQGDLMLFRDRMVFGDYVVPIYDLRIASPISGRKFNFVIRNSEYLVIGPERFNGLKYVLMFNKLDTEMNRKKYDIYYNLEERE